jgi:hypothetical protein
MRIKASCIVAFVAGAITGGFVATKIAKKQCEKDKAAYALELHRTYSAILEENGVATFPASEEVVSEEPVEEDDVIVKRSATAPDLACTFVPGENYHDYTQYASTVVTPPPAADNDDIPGVEPDIKIITIEDFGEIPTFSKTTLIYKPNGELIEESSEALVENWSDTVGHSWLQYFVNGTADEIYIRNSRLKIDYEIIRDRDTDD